MGHDRNVVRISVTVEMDCYVVDNNGNPIPDELFGPSKSQVIEFVGAAIGFYDQHGDTQDDIFPESCSGLCLQNWKVK